MRAIYIGPMAKADIDKAAIWYENAQAGLGAEWLEAFEKTLIKVKTHPERYPLTNKAVRRIKLRRFPYTVYYLLHDDRVHVLAVLHDRQNPVIQQTRFGSL